MNCNFTEFVIPEQVIEISSFAFQRTPLRSIVIPESVTSIGELAFTETNLEEVTIPESVKSIGDRAFFECTSLISVKILGNTNIGSEVFACCYKLYKIINNSDLELAIGSKDNGYITYYAEEIIDKNGNKTYKDEESGFAFVDTVDCFRFMVKNGEYTLIAYYGDEDTVRLPDDINGKEYSIYRMTGIKNVTIPGTIKNIGKNAFSGTLGSVIIEEGVQNIGFSAIYTVSYISLPASLQSIDSQNFYEKIRRIELSSESDYFVLKDGVLYTKDYSSLIRCPIDVTNLTIPKETTYIASWAFRDCVSLIDVYYEGTENEWLNVEMGWLSSNPSEYAKHFYINGNEFGGTIIISGKTFISNSQFINNTKITEVVVEEGVKNIYDSAFSGCVNLRKITLPASLEYMGQSVFWNCNNLTEVVFNGTFEDWFNVGFSTYSYFLNNVNTLYIGGENVANKRVVLPDTVTKIQRSVFENFKYLTEIVISDNVEVIENGAFGSCVNLSKVTFGNNSKLLTIEDY